MKNAKVGEIWEYRNGNDWAHWIKAPDGFVCFDGASPPIGEVVEWNRFDHHNMKRLSRETTGIAAIVESLREIAHSAGAETIEIAVSKDHFSLACSRAE